MASAGASAGRKLAPQPSRHVKLEKSASCAVCRRPGCQLQSHQTYLTHRRRETKDLIKHPKQSQETAQTKPSSPTTTSSTSYASSYAFTRTPRSASPHGINSGRLDGFHDLPVPQGHRTELHHAVYSGKCREPFTLFAVVSHHRLICQIK